MRRTILWLAIVFTGVAPPAIDAQGQFKLVVSLVDATGAPVKTLTPDQIRVAENGVDARVINVEPLNAPPKIQILVDNGTGLGADSLNALRGGVRAFLEALPSGLPGLEVALYATAPGPRVLLRSTTDRAAWMEGVGRLVPDGGAGQFIEALADAAQRIESDKGNSTPVIVSVTASSGSASAQRTIDRMLQQLQRGRATVHVVMLIPSRPTGGFDLIEFGGNLAKTTGGRFQSLGAASGLTRLLTQLGAEVAQGIGATGGQFRITVERPSGASGPLGKVGFGATGTVATKMAIE